MYCLAGRRAPLPPPAAPHAPHLTDCASASTPLRDWSETMIVTRASWAATRLRSAGNRGEPWRAARGGRGACVSGLGGAPCAPGLVDVS